MTTLNQDVENNLQQDTELLPKLDEPRMIDDSSFDDTGVQLLTSSSEANESINGPTYSARSGRRVLTVLSIIALVGIATTCATLTNSDSYNKDRSEGLEESNHFHQEIATDFSRRLNSRRQECKRTTARDPLCPCLTDLKLCPDGSMVSRDVNNNCDFSPCPPPRCTLDVKQCPDGSAVSRDPSNNCQFFPCPPTACPLDIYTCPDGFTLSRQGPHCLFPACPPTGCPLDIYTCPDGTSLSRQGPNCLFPACPPTACPLDIYTCPDGTTLSREGPECLFPACPPSMCPLDVIECPDGSFTGRNPANNCVFFPCPMLPLP
jgi:hypothetical protein